jgi:hypothetical protein
MSMERDCHKAPALKLLPYRVRENLPILGSQQGLGGRAKAWTRWFISRGSLEWYITEGSARRNGEGRAVDYLLFGLVVGQGTKLDYFWLSDFADRGPTDLVVERDLHWRPKALAEIAPEMFKTPDKTLED